MKLKYPILLAIVFALALLPRPAGSDASAQRADVEQRINSLISQMTLEEKLGQLQQLDGESNGNYRPEHLNSRAKVCWVPSSTCVGQRAQTNYNARRWNRA